MSTIGELRRRWITEARAAHRDAEADGLERLRLDGTERCDDDVDIEIERSIDTGSSAPSDAGPELKSDLPWRMR